MTVQIDRDEIRAMQEQRGHTHHLCPECDGSGWKDIKNPVPMQVYCSCPTGQRKRKEARERQEQDWQAAKDADLWNNPEHWPW